MSRLPDRTTEHLIEEASALPPGNPDRKRLLADIDELDEESRRTWIERSGSYEVIRSRLREVAPPDNLVDGLLEIPDAIETDGRRHSRLMIGGSLAAAAVSVLLVLGTTAFMKQSQHDPFHELTMLMIEDHENHPSLTVESAEPADIEDELNRSGKLRVRIPAMGDEFSLVGGRLCKFDARPIAYTRWRDAERGMPHSLYQVDAGLFDLPDSFDRREFVVEGHRIVFWHEGSAAYAMVCEAMHLRGTENTED